MFNVWNPLLTATECQLDVTRAECFRLGRGTRELMTSFLGAWGVTGTVEEWTVEPMRSSYFSDFLDDENWRDRWQRIWHVRVRGAFVCPPEPTPVEYQYVHETDPTEEDEVRSERDTCRALLIAGARETREAIETVMVPRVKALLSQHGVTLDAVELSIRLFAPGEPAPSDEIRRFMSNMPPSVATKVLADLERASLPLYQVRALISGTTFPGDEPRLSMLRDSLKASGYFTHRHALEFDALTPTG